MLAREPTEEELRATFEDLIANPEPDGMVPSDTGLDDDTIDALNRLWAAGPNPPQRLIDAAEAEFEAQLDGSHAAEAQAQMRAMFDAAVADRTSGS